MSSLVAVVGPTAVGKSRLAIRLAQTFRGEIISADSRQVYRYMDIGTDKPSPEELSLVPHHLISIVNPDEDFSLTQYQQMAYQAIADIQGRGKLPLLAGGSGLYVWSVLEGWEIPHVSPDSSFRHDMERLAEEGGADELYMQLSKLDPLAAQKIDRRNLRRVIRALEVCQHTSKPISVLQRKTAPPFHTLIIGLTLDREELYRRIDRRVDAMIAGGLVAEVERLVAMGYGFDLPSMSGIGYRQIGMYLRGKVSRDEAVRQIKHETRRFVRHQYNWFRLKDDKIKWYDAGRGEDEAIIGLVADFIFKQGE